MPFRKIVPRNTITLHSPNDNFLARLTYIFTLEKGFTIIHVTSRLLSYDRWSSEGNTPHHTRPSILRNPTKKLNNCNKSPAGHSFLCSYPTSKVPAKLSCSWSRELIYSLLLFQCWTLTSLLLLWRCPTAQMLEKITGRELVPLRALFWMLASCLTKNFKYFVVGFSITGTTPCT